MKSREAMAGKQGPRKGSVTIVDVAQRAGVSIKTVSRVVNNEPNVRAQTRERVLEAVGALRYMPNAAARSLSGRRSRVIGLVYENANEFSYLQGVLDGALSACEKREHALLLRPLSLPNPHLAAQIGRFVRQARAEGVILPAPMGDFSELSTLLRKMSVPFAAITPRAPAAGEINIRCKDEEASCALTEFLIARGHTAIGFVKGHPHHGASDQRFRGYRRALRRHGVAHRPALVRQGYFDFDSGQAAARVLLELADAPTAIIASNDDMAAGALLEARQRGLSIPEDLSVAGFDDTAIASRLWPPLTTVRQPIRRMAETAATRLIERLSGAGKVVDDAPFDCELVVRGSTA